MKLNFVPTLIAAGISALIAYGLYSFNDTENRELLAIGSFVSLAITLALAIGATFQQARTSTNIRTISSVFFMLAFISNLIFTFVSFSIPVYVIINGILILVYILLAYSISKANQ